jgi:hypothetical protein
VIRIVRLFLMAELHLAVVMAASIFDSTPSCAKITVPDG